jgi:hypothetical protein
MTKLGQFTITNQIVTNKRFKKLGFLSAFGLAIAHILVITSLRALVPSFPITKGLPYREGLATNTALLGKGSKKFFSEFVSSSITSGLVKETLCKFFE